MLCKNDEKITQFVKFTVFDVRNTLTSKRRGGIWKFPSGWAPKWWWLAPRNSIMAFQPRWCSAPKTRLLAIESFPFHIVTNNTGKTKHLWNSLIILAGAQAVLLAFGISIMCYLVGALAIFSAITFKYYCLIFRSNLFARDSYEQDRGHWRDHQKIYIEQVVKFSYEVYYSPDAHSAIMFFSFRRLQSSRCFRMSSMLPV